MEVLVYLLVLFFSVIWNLVNTKTHKEANRKGALPLPLPPGSMGYPYIGETLRLYSRDPSTFFASKQKKYGEIFKSHILGCPCVMLASPEAIRFVLVNQAHLFKPTFPKSKERLIGFSALFFHQGDYHTRLRKLVHSSLSLEKIKHMVADIQGVVKSGFDEVDGGVVLNTFEQMKKIAFEVGILAIFGHLEEHYKDELRKNYNTVNKAYNSLPIIFPGSPYNNALLARKRLSKIASEIIGERRKEKKSVEKDILGVLLNMKDEKVGILGEDEIIDNIIGLLFAAQDTTATAMTWILKYLDDNLQLVQDLKAEHTEILKLNNEGQQSLCWSQTRNMPLTHKIILETLRMATIITFTFREAVTDVQYKGYLIPKGWKVMPLFRNIHHNLEFFNEPQKFDPSRFEVAPKPNTFMPFGNGAHSCIGNELARLQMLIVVHHIVTHFRWEVVGYQNGIEYNPFPVPKHGLRARFWKIRPAHTCADKYMRR